MSKTGSPERWISRQIVSLRPERGTTYLMHSMRRSIGTAVLCSLAWSPAPANEIADQIKRRSTDSVAAYGIKDEAEREEFDNLSGEIKQIDAELKDLRDL